MYLRFGTPIDTGKPARASEQKWVATVKQRTQESLEQALADLLVIRTVDPYRELNPLAWRAATQPPIALSHELIRAPVPPKLDRGGPPAKIFPNHSKALSVR